MQNVVLFRMTSQGDINDYIARPTLLNRWRARRIRTAVARAWLAEHEPPTRLDYADAADRLRDMVNELPQQRRADDGS